MRRVVIGALILLLMSLVQCSKRPFRFDSAKTRTGKFLTIEVKALDGSVAPLIVSLADPLNPRPLQLWELHFRSPLSIWVGVDREQDLFSVLTCNLDDVNFVEHLSHINIEHPIPINGDFRNADEALVQGIVKRFMKYEAKLRDAGKSDVLDWFCRPEGRLAFRKEFRIEEQREVQLEPD